MGKLVKQLTKQENQGVHYIGQNVHYVLCET